MYKCKNVETGEEFETDEDKLESPIEYLFLCNNCEEQTWAFYSISQADTCVECGKYLTGSGRL